MHRLIVASLTALLLGAAAVAQGPEVPPAPAGADKRPDPKEMLKEIERDMAAVEKILLEAKPGSGQQADLVVKKIEKLLDDAKKAESKIISRIDKLIDEIKRQQRQRQKQQQQQQQQQKQRRQQKPQGQQRRDEERDRFQNQRPKDKQQNDKQPNDPKNQKTDRKPKDPTDKANHPDKSGAWGKLPDRLFKLLTSREQTVFPPEFRTYIERYFRRLNENAK